MEWLTHFCFVFSSDGHDGLTAADIVSNLAQSLKKTSCCRFNINRANVWDGALRGFRRSSFDPTYSLMVKFTDDAGMTEEALDSGGPTREFLTLLMDTIKTRRIFEGKDNAKYLSFDSKGNTFVTFLQCCKSLCPNA